MTRISLTQPDDWHVHLRDGVLMKTVVQHTAEVYGRALVMPNLETPIVTLELALSYRDRILKSLPNNTLFQPLMTLYLTADTIPAQIRQAKDNGLVSAVKMYPAGATTNSALGIRSIDQADKVFEAMQQMGMPLSVHGEVADPEVDIFDRECVFIERVLTKLRARYPQLKIVLEHVSTKEAVQFVQESSSNLVATITAHHLLLNRNDLLAHGINPHYFCLPIVKRETDRNALVAAATSGNPKFFLGTDSAPHLKTAKEAGRGKAGIYSAPVSLALYAEVFENQAKLNLLEGFASFYGADFYNLPRNGKKISLVKDTVSIPDHYPCGNQCVQALRAGATVAWRIEV